MIFPWNASYIESFDFAMSTPAASAPYGGDPPTIKKPESSPAPGERLVPHGMGIYAASGRMGLISMV